MKNLFLTSAIFLIVFSFLTGCESSTKRREFCDCVDIAKMLTNGLTDELPSSTDKQTPPAATDKH